MTPDEEARQEEYLNARVRWDEEARRTLAELSARVREFGDRDCPALMLLAQEEYLNALVMWDGDHRPDTRDCTCWRGGRLCTSDGFTQEFQCGVHGSRRRLP